jgi:CyaY protein
MKEEAFKTLENIVSLLDNHNEIDVDFEDGKIEINFHSTHILLSYHGIMKQIWMASTKTGAHHFEFLNNNWVCTRSKQPLMTVLGNEVNLYA